MNKFLVIGNSKKPETERVGVLIKNYVKEKGGSCVNINGYIKKEDIPEDIECALVLGGDGTLLQAARNMVGMNIPFVGINYGNLGFLAEVDEKNMYTAIDRLLSGDFSIESRMMLMGQVYRDGELLTESFALNDVVISRSFALKVMNFKVAVNNMDLNRYIADGIVIATPTGSTAYSMSAGGPIVKPSARLMVMTPICPHTLSTRSIILDKDDVIEITIQSRNDEKEEYNSNVYFDGDFSMELKANDKVIIRKSKINTDIVKFNTLSFLEILRKKMDSNENSQT